MKTIYFSAAAILAATSFAMFNREVALLPEGYEVDLAEPIGDDSICCYLYGHADFQYDPSGEDRDYAKTRHCLVKNWGNEYMITAVSFYDTDSESGGLIQDNLESYKCGENVAMEICSYTFGSEQIQSEKYGTFYKYKCNADGTLSVAAPGDRVSYYYQRENLASSILLYPIKKPDCVVLYSMYDGADCEGNQFTVSKSFESAQEMKDQFPGRFKDDDGELRTIRSIKHPARSTVTVYTDDNFQGGAWYTENTSTIENRPDFICSTFRFDRSKPIDLDNPGDNLGLDEQIPQASVKWEYEDCVEPVLDLGDPEGVYFWVISDKYLSYRDTVTDTDPDAVIETD